VFNATFSNISAISWRPVLVHYSYSEPTSLCFFTLMLPASEEANSLWFDQWRSNAWRHKIKICQHFVTHLDNRRRHHIDVFPGRLAGYGISIQQISNAIGSANVSSHTGDMTTEGVISCPTSNSMVTMP
jgi:hypothetical protein